MLEATPGVRGAEYVNEEADGEMTEKREPRPSIIGYMRSMYGEGLLVEVGDCLSADVDIESRDDFALLRRVA